MDILLHDNRQLLVQRIQLLQDTVGIVVLLPAALPRLQTRAPTTFVLGLVEVLAIAFAVGSAISELKHKPHGANRVDLSNLFLGLVLLVEWAFRVKSGHKAFSPMLLTALAALFLAFFRTKLQDRMGTRRLIRIDEHGVQARLSRLRRFTVRWTELNAVEDSGGVMRLRTRAGRTHSINLGRYQNREEIRAALMSYTQRYLRGGET